MQFSIIEHELDESLPIIYMWEIYGQSGELLGRYVGKAKAGASRPLKHYKRNVKNILMGKPYRKNNPSGYRRIHHALAKAEQEGFRITLQFLCNIHTSEDINEVEQIYIRSKNCVGSEAWQLNG